MHRLGRCGRAGKAGSGLLLLTSAEARPMLRELKDGAGAPLVLAGRASTITGGDAVLGDLSPTPRLRAVCNAMDKARGGALDEASAGGVARDGAFLML